MNNSEENAQEAVFHLPENVRVREVAELRTELLARLRDQPGLTIDGTRVERIDISGVQLLIAAQRQAERDGQALSFRIPDDGAVAKLIRDSGLAHAFNLNGNP
ncbi:MAG: STAS domain-containing protein [Magnetococcales bacterium]|nr:STAS domain-containing protein [Magnetococcales bacterium]